MQIKKRTHIIYCLKYLIYAACFILSACHARYPEKIQQSSSSPENHYAAVDSLIKSISNDTTALMNYLALSVSTGDQYAEMSVYDKLGTYYVHNYLYNKAIDYHKSYLEAARLSRNLFHIIRALNNLAYDYAQTQSYNESAEYYFQALSQTNEPGEQKQMLLQTEIGRILNGLGEIYLYINQPDEAMNYFSKAWQEIQSNNSEGRATILQNMGVVYEYVKQYDSAHVFYQKSLEYHIKSNSNSGLNNCFWQMGNLYMIEEDYENALVYLESAYNSLLPTSDKLNRLKVTISLGEVNVKKGNYSKAEAYLNDACRVSGELNLSAYLGKTFFLLSELHRMQGKLTLALEERSLSDEYSKAFIQERNTNLIMSHRLSYEKERNKKEMHRLAGQHQIEKEKTRKALTLTFLFIILLIFIIFILIQNIRLRRQNNLTSLQLEKIRSGYYTKISAELKTAASIIIGQVDRLKRNLQKDKTDYPIEMEILLRQSNDLLQLINEIASLDNLQKNNQSDKVIKGNIIPYLRYLYECFAPMAETKRIAYTFQSNVSEIYLDYMPEYLRMVMHNLLYNTMKRCTEHNHIKVSVNYEMKKNDYSIEVFCNGTGLNQKDIPHVFDSNLQVTDTKTEDHNAGVELTITTQLIKKMNGTINIKNGEFNNTIITVNLPIHNGKVPLIGDPIIIRKHPGNKRLFIPENPHSQNSDVEKPVVLIVEENRDMSYYLISVLKDKYFVLTERNGEDAIKTAQEKIPDLIIADTVLSGVDGFQLCKRIKNSASTNHKPIVLLTFIHSKEVRIKGIEYGADAFLLKPVNEEELLVVMDQLLATRKQLREKYNPFVRVNANREEKTAVSNNENIEFLEMVTNQIYKELTNTESIIEKLFSEVCLSSSQLNRKIKAITGLTTSNYILKTRLNKAKKLLTISQKPIGDIATECGFNDFAYFSRSFKKEFGMTPTTFQRIPQSAN